VWDGRVVAAIVKAAKEDLQQHRWTRDFADKLRDRDIALDALRHLVNRFDLMVLYWHRGMRAIGFWLKELNLICLVAATSGKVGHCLPP
jgi:hypothetical protein